MLALQRVREHPDEIRHGARIKGEPESAESVDTVLELDRQARALRATVEAGRAEQRRSSTQIRGAPSDTQRAALAVVKQRIQAGEAELTELEAQIEGLLLRLPNPPHKSVPEGTAEAGNVTLRTWGAPSEFGFEPRTHADLGDGLGIFDFERAAKLSGARFAVVRGAGARLERALITFMLDVAVNEHGYTEVAPPYLVRRECMTGAGTLPKFEADAFRTDDDHFLIPTAEVPVTNLYRDEIIDGATLPIAHVAYTPCFRREAGAAGKDTRGYIRLHQFGKVEMVRFVEPDGSLDALEVMTGQAECILQKLGIHYRVLLMCTGDLGFAQWKKYDIEAWAPGMNRWLEVSSCSVFGDFQARRANIRYRPGPSERPRHVHTLNGSALALPRTLATLLETYQQPDGGVVIPEVLRRYMDGLEKLERPGSSA